MRKKILSKTLFLAGMLFPVMVAGQEPVAWWPFERLNAHDTEADPATGADLPEGYYENPAGISGSCLKLDGYTTRLTREADAVPPLDEALSIECWIALQSLPWNWSAVVSQGLLPGPDRGKPGLTTSKDSRDKDGAQFLDRIFLGVNAHGQPGFRLMLDGTTYACVAEKKIPLLQWNHLAATYTPGSGMKIYLNGEEVAHREATGALSDDPSTAMLIGMNINRLGPEGSERQASADIGSRMVLHGLLDELRIYDQAVPVEKLADHYRQELPDEQQPLQWTPLPSGPEELPERFDAVYTRLEYTSEWEAHWNTGEYPDVLVHFDLLPVRFVFWRGTGYGGVWVTENGLWMGDQSLERSNAGKSPMGCSEHMSDKQTRYSHVRIIEKNDARIVIHWRYAISDILYDIFGMGEDNPQGEWADEYYYIYPDGVTTRHQVLYTGYLSHEWQETIVINHPGTSPDDNIALDAMTLLNMEGESRTYSWRDGGPAAFPEPRHANIQLVNLKSVYKPFIIFEPNPRIRPFNRSTIRPEYAHFPWWNHWPVAQVPNDGRRAFGPDRPSHSSLSQSVEGSEVIHKRDDGAFEVMTLVGMTNQSAGSLVPLARSWNQPPELDLTAKGFTSAGYSKQQRAYIIDKERQDAGELTFSIHANEQSPLVHPCFVIENWGAQEIRLTCNGLPADPGSFRFGFRKTLTGTDLVIWTGLKSAQPSVFSISPVM
jgi:hypothetical protein